MSPKFCPDADGHIAPCAIISDWNELEKWEDFKGIDLKLRGKERKAGCSCRYFEGKIPQSHKCFVIKKQSPLILFFKSLRMKLLCV
jgi:hypothetical protein